MLLLDEVFAVGDEAFQRKCVEKIIDFKRAAAGPCASSRTSAPAVERLCERAVLLAKGRGRVRRAGLGGDHALPRSRSRSRRTPTEVGAGCGSGGPARCASTGSRSRAPTVSRGTTSSRASRSRSVLARRRARRPARPGSRSSCATLTARCSVRASRISASSAGTGRRGIGEVRFLSSGCRSARASSSSASALVDAGGIAPVPPGRPRGAVHRSVVRPRSRPVLLRGRVVAGRTRADRVEAG